LKERIDSEREFFPFYSAGAVPLIVNQGFFCDVIKLITVAKMGYVLL
jgi:hypothetical protein